MMKKIVRLISSTIIFIFANIIGVFAMNLSFYKNTWLIAERGYDARDNGYHLFKYIRSNHPEINAYFLIDKNSSDFHKVNSIGKTVNYKSLQHYLLFVISKVKISTHIMGYSPDAGVFLQLDKLGLIRGKKVFLQHGITKDDIKSLYYPNAKLDLFVSGALPEFSYITHKYMHDEDVVQLLGFCRYDELNLEVPLKKQILLMPTWRRYINKCKNSDEFKRTEYFKVYQSVLKSKKINKLLSDYNYKLVFYPHFEIQKFLSCFSTDNDAIEIASFKNNDVQNLLKSSSILITDFSSVFFDFAYMKKPQIYYQFDEKEYRQSHYSEGYFSYEKDGFGPIVHHEDELFKELENILKGNSKLSDNYLRRVNNFFTINDNKNCERNFVAINRLIKGKLDT